MTCLKVFLGIAVGVAGSASAADAWPFAILRNYGSYEANRAFLDRVFAAQERHPGLIEEIWFGPSGDCFADSETYGREVRRANEGAIERCRRLGIAFSWQEGMTLNHNVDDLPHPGIPDDAWVVDLDGRRRSGVLCCTSPFAIDWSFRKAKAVLAALKPASYWPDDDLRIMKLDWDRPSICYCPRCLALLGQRLGRPVTREELVAELEGPDAKAETRRAWCAFNGEMLAKFAAAYRRAVDETSPETRMGIQASGAFRTANGDLYPRILELFAGARWAKTGIRPGGGYYCDLASCQEMVDKVIETGDAAAQARRSGRAGQICYEVENWPHIGALKSPGGMMSECALALASGCDSLALYWGADQNGETDESYDFWLETFAAWKPFLLKVRDAFRGTFRGGLAMCFGEDYFASDRWLNRNEPDIYSIALNALPVTTAAADPDVLLVNARTVKTLSSNDLARVFSRTTLFDPESFAALGRKFPSLAFTRKVSVEPLDAEHALATANRSSGYEKFRTIGQCEGVLAKLRVRSDDVVALSEMTVDPTTCGTCVIPTEFGGKAVVVQDIHSARPRTTWAGCRRHGTLDALDLAVSGKMPARLLTDGYACMVSVGKTADGKTAGVFVLNLGTGETPPLELAIRRGATTDWTLARPGQGDVAADVVRQEGDETVVRLPSLPPFGVVLLSVKKGIIPPSNKTRGFWGQAPI